MSSPPSAPEPKTFRPPQGGEVIEHVGNRYYLGARIGQGHFGAVYECTDDWGNELVAKVLLPVNRTYEQVRDGWTKELQNLLTLRHPHITFLYNAFEYKDTFYLIIERCSSDLHSMIAMPGLKGDLWLPHLANNLLQAVAFLHNAGYVHKDIHPGNVFLTWLKDRMVPDQQPVLQFKVGDLGISRLEKDIHVFNTALAQWMLPPEFLDPTSFGAVGRPVDIYHAGLLLMSLSLGSVPEFSKEDILAGRPRETAERLKSPYSGPIARALRRHVPDRTATAMEFWQQVRGVTRAA